MDVSSDERKIVGKEKESTSRRNNYRGMNTDADILSIAASVVAFYQLTKSQCFHARRPCQQEKCTVFHRRRNIISSATGCVSDIVRERMSFG